MRELFVTTLTLAVVLAAPKLAAADGWEAISFKLTNNGALDTTYGDMGPNNTRTGSTLPVVTGHEFLYDVVRNADGKIIAGGTFTGGPGGTTKILIGQRLPDGTPDANFGYLGVTTAHIAGAETERVQALQLVPQQRILAGVLYYPPAFHAGAALMRFNSNGTLDDSFGDHGVVIFESELVDEPTLGSILYSPANDRILMGGVDLIGPFVARFTSDGVLDTAFHNGGVFRPQFEGGTDEVHVLAVDGTGKVVLAGQTLSLRAAAMLLLPSGAVDTAYGGTDGILLGTVLAQPRAAAFDSNGRVVFAGVEIPTILAPLSKAFIARTRTNGTLDKAFNGNGWLRVTSNPTADRSFSSVSVTAAGITAAGDTGATLNGPHAFFVARYTGTGAATSFGERTFDFGETDIGWVGAFVLAGVQPIVVGSVKPQ